MKQPADRTPWIRRARLVLCLGALTALGACIMMPPTLPPETPRRGIRPRSYKMKLAVFNFTDQTGSAGKLIETIPDMLSTELFTTRRFELSERAEIRGIEAREIEKIRSEYKLRVDAFLVGGITRFSVDDKTMTLDVRAINAYNGTVMFASHFDVHYSGVLDVKANREDVAKIAEAVYRAFPELGDPNVRVVSLSGRTVTINLGRQDGVKVGMGALIIARGDTLKDPVSGDELADEIYVGEVYVVEAGDKTSKAIIAQQAVEGTPSVKLNDAIRFK
jgi:hypothetical protein